MIKKQISSLTRGLLVVTGDYSPSFFADGLICQNLDFFHKTVRDYLETPRRLTEFLDEFANINLLQLHGRLKLVQIVRGSSLLEGNREEEGILRWEIDGTFLSYLPRGRLLKYFSQYRLPSENWIQYSHAEMTLLHRYCGTLIGTSYRNVFQQGRGISFGRLDASGSFLHYAISHGQIRYTREELRKGVEQQSVSSGVFLPTADSPSDLNALLSALLDAASLNDTCELLLHNGFSARQSVDYFQRAETADSFAKAGSVSIWLLFVLILRTRLSYFNVLEKFLRADPELPGILVFFLSGDGVFHAEGSSDLFSLTIRDLVTIMSPPNAPALSGLLPPTDRKSIVSDRVVEAVRTGVAMRRVSRIGAVRNLKPGKPVDVVLITPSDDKVRQLISRPVALVDPSTLDGLEQWLRGPGIDQAYTVLGAASQSEVRFGEDWRVRVW